MFNLSFQHSESGVKGIVGQLKACRSKIPIQDGDRCPESVSSGKGGVEEVRRHAVLLIVSVVNLLKVDQELTRKDREVHRPFLGKPG